MELHLSKPCAALLACAFQSVLDVNSDFEFLTSDEVELLSDMLPSLKKYGNSGEEYV